MPPQAFRSAARLPAGSADRFISAFLWIPPPIGGPFSGQSMSPKHILLVPALALLMYLGMYSWNQRTHILDNFAANTGLEASGVVLKSVRMVQDTVMGAWNRYLDLAPQPEHFSRQFGVTTPSFALSHSFKRNFFVTPAWMKSQGNNSSAGRSRSV